VPVCRKSYDISILGCRRCHPCWIHASGHNS
jgi:hypothetical protein